MLVKSFFITLTQRYWHLVDSQNRNGGLCWRREQKPFLSAIIEGNTLRSLRLRSVFVTEICLIRPRRPDIATPLSNPPPPLLSKPTTTKGKRVLTFFRCPLSTLCRSTLAAEQQVHCSSGFNFFCHIIPPKVVGCERVRISYNTLLSALVSIGWWR